MGKEIYIITFKSTHYAMMAEKKLKNYKIQIMPTPREITAHCGLSIAFDVEDYESIVKEIKIWVDSDEMIDLYQLDKETRYVKKIEMNTIG